MTDVSKRVLSLLRMHPGWYALMAAVGLSLIGVEAIRTIDPYHATKQLIWFALSLMAMAVCLVPRPRVIGLFSYVLLLITLSLLVFVVVPGVPRAIVPPINNTTSWIDLQFMKLQPSELAKITFVLAMAWYLRHRRSYRTLRGLLVPFLMMFVPVGLILKQPDLGTALLFAPTLLVMLVAAGAKLKHLGSLLGIAFLLIGLAVTSIYLAPSFASFVFKPHQQNRFKAMISLASGDNQYNNTLNYQPLKSMQLIGSGQWRGYGRQRSNLVIDVHHLPEAHNDMIYAVIVNRWGLIGALLVDGLYLLIVISFTVIAARHRDPFARLAMTGFTGLLFAQMTIHVAVNIGLVPVTGITLPFISYGGSSLVATYVMMGLAMNFAAIRPVVFSPPSFEFDRPSTSASDPGYMSRGLG